MTLPYEKCPTNGSAFLHNGDLFYSPNCCRRIVIPENHQNHPPYPFPARTTKIESFLEPRWWAKPYPYLPFVPLRPSFVGPAFSKLDNSAIVFADDRDVHMLDPKVAQDWRDLEDTVIWAVYHLKSGPTLMPPFLKPIPPSLLGFSKKYSTYGGVRSRVYTSRNWFGMWIGLIAWLIANTERFYPVEMENNGNWFAILSRSGLPQWWLGALQTSEAAKFSLESPRAGVILDILSSEPRQPPVKWFLEFNIPVWYPWTPARHTRVFGHSYEELDLLRPPAHLLQEATTFLTHAPSPSFPLPQKKSHEMTAQEFTKAREAILEKKPWIKFFEARKKQNELKLLNEKPAARQTRLNRERKPPRASADVYQWEWSESSPLEFVRVRVSKREREDVLGMHSDAQCIYDSFSNVWDVCEEFGPDNESSDSEHSDSEHSDTGLTYHTREEDMDAFFPPMHPEEEEQAHETFFESRISNKDSNGTKPSPPQSIVNELHSQPLNDEFDVLQYITLHYGFLTPIPLPETEPPVPTTDWNDCLKTLGLRTIEQHAPVPGVTSHITKFVKSVLKAEDNFELWDLCPGHCRSLDQEVLQKCFRRLGDFYVVLGSSGFLQGDVSFMIGLPLSDTALYVFCLLQSESHSASSLATHLVEKGIKFSTLLQLDTRPSLISLSAIQVVIPQRLPDYVFSLTDYEVYIRQRAQLLCSPRGRAALLHGGLISRIAKEHIAADSASMGPSSAVIDFRLGTCIQDGVDGTFFWDDKLSESELDMICGMHKLHTGRADQIANISWWPSAAIWDMAFNSYNWHHWTEWDEVWYQDRCKHIQNSDPRNGVPLSQKKWREKLRGPGAWRKFIQSVDTQANSTFQ